METLAQNTGIKSLSKAALGSAVVATVKALQSSSTITLSRLNQFLEGAKQKIEVEMDREFGACDNPRSNHILSNYNDSDILKFYICKIIKNGYLDDNVAQDFACLLNNYTSEDNQFIAIRKKDYEQEKKANADAVLRAAIGVGVSSAGVDAIYDSATFGKSQFTVPKTESSTEAAEKALLTGTLGAITSTATAAAGIRIFKSLNAQIPIKYKPDFDKIITAIVNVQNQLNEITKQETECKIERLNLIRDNFKSQLEEKIKLLGGKQNINRENIGDFKYIDRNGQEYNIISGMIYMPRNIDILNTDTIKTIVYDNTNNYNIESDCVQYCNSTNIEKKNELNKIYKDLFKLKDQFLAALSLSDKNEDGISVTKYLLKDLNSLLVNLELKDISNEEISNIRTKITEIQDKRRPILSTFARFGKAVQDVSSDLSSKAINVTKNVGSQAKNIGKNVSSLATDGTVVFGEDKFKLTNPLNSMFSRKSQATYQKPKSGEDKWTELQDSDDEGILGGKRKTRKIRKKIKKIRKLRKNKTRKQNKQIKSYRKRHTKRHHK